MFCGCASVCTLTRDMRWIVLKSGYLPVWRVRRYRRADVQKCGRAEQVRGTLLPADGMKYRTVEREDGSISPAFGESKESSAASHSGIALRPITYRTVRTPNPIEWGI